MRHPIGVSLTLVSTPPETVGTWHLVTEQQLACEVHETLVLEMHKYVHWPKYMLEL
jgi:hypothetical protein